MPKRVVLAYSGGLDTSVAVRWMADNQGVEVIALAVDVGQSSDDWDIVRERALAAGAVDAIVVDARDGVTALDGRIPVNPSGGLLSKGHPIGATGCAQLTEIVWQLRGDAGDRQVKDGKAKVGLTQNGGGMMRGEAAAMAIHVLER